MAPRGLSLRVVFLGCFVLALLAGTAASVQFRGADSSVDESSAGGKPGSEEVAAAAPETGTDEAVGEGVDESVLDDESDLEDASKESSLVADAEEGDTASTGPSFVQQAGVDHKNGDSERWDSEDALNSADDEKDSDMDSELSESEAGDAKQGDSLDETFGGAAVEKDVNPHHGA